MRKLLEATMLTEREIAEKIEWETVSDEEKKYGFALVSWLLYSGVIPEYEVAEWGKTSITVEIDTEYLKEPNLNRVRQETGAKWQYMESGGLLTIPISAIEKLKKMYPKYIVTPELVAKYAEAEKRRDVAAKVTIQSDIYKFVDDALYDIYIESEGLYNSAIKLLVDGIKSGENPQTLKSKLTSIYVKDEPEDREDIIKDIEKKFMQIYQAVVQAIEKYSKLPEATMIVESYYVNADDKSTWVAKVAEINKDFADLLGEDLKFVLKDDKLHLEKKGVKDAAYSLGNVYAYHSKGELKAAIGTMRS